MSKIDKALEYAVQKHKGQYRKHSGLPFIVHPMSVMKLLSDWGVKDEDVLVSALLHDVIEDCKGTTKEEIASLFNEKVASIVFELSFDENAYKDKNKYLESFIDKSPEALIIKKSDRTNNVLDYSLTDPKYAIKYLEKGKVIFELSISDKFKEFFKQYQTTHYYHLMHIIYFQKPLIR